MCARKCIWNSCVGFEKRITQYRLNKHMNIAYILYIYIIYGFNIFLMVRIVYGVTINGTYQKRCSE